MSLQTFTPAIRPDVGSGGSHQFRTLTANFGDGYDQEAADGINPLKSTYTLNWSNLTVAQADAVIAFFDARGGYEAFNYTIPGQSTAYKFRCKQYGDTWAKGDRKDVSATLTRVYDL